MKRGAGFTLIELLITITIMVILLGLTVISLRSNQASARDEERKTDIEIIARGLERRYVAGNPRATSTEIKQGAYPGVNETLHILGDSRAGFTPAQIVGGYVADAFPGVDEKNIIPPGGDQFDKLKIICVWACQPAETQSVVDSVTQIDTYVYEPITRDGAICSGGDCSRFNLYYRTETDNVVHKITSRHQ